MSFFVNIIQHAPVIARQIQFKFIITINNTINDWVGNMGGDFE